MANYVLNDEKMFADITDGIAIVINSETGIYYGMDTLGTVVLENIMNGSNTEEILVALQGIANAPASLANDFQKFIDSMLENEIVLSSDAGSNPVAIPADLAIEEFTIGLQAFDDAQELLLADPIHEVKEDTGWTPEKDSIGYTKEETKEREKKMEN